MLNVTFAGDTVTLEQKQLAVGDMLPDAIVYDNNLVAFHMAETKGVRVFLTVPSLDTPVCDLEVRTFNAKAAELPDVSVYAVSVDLPFAQARWCGNAKAQNVVTLSDYNGAEFGRATGTFIKELALLTRAVFVIDPEGKVVYAEYVPEITNAPDYDAVYACLQQL
jgi:thiol peroxidase